MLWVRAFACFYTFVAMLTLSAQAALIIGQASPWLAGPFMLASAAAMTGYANFAYSFINARGVR